MTARDPWASYRADVTAALREEAWMQRQATSPRSDAVVTGRVVAAWQGTVRSIRREYTGAARIGRLAAVADALADVLDELDQSGESEAGADRAGWEQ